MATAGILDHIERLNPKAMFTTRDVLQYGSRGAVDTCLYRLVKAGTIRRLARGVFIRDRNARPRTEEIANVKAMTFGKRIHKPATAILQELRIISSNNPNQSHFVVTGHSSTFESYRGPIILTGIAQRKAKLCETKVGHKLYALWQFKDYKNFDRAIAITSRNLNRQDREELRRCSSLMPAWLHELFRDRYARILAS
ncbi:MAG TPA: hypothetical protein V6C97_13060 [Oculatellaceae cyanobacterium]